MEAYTSIGKKALEMQNLASLPDDLVGVSR